MAIMMLLLALTLSLMSCAQSQDYHYPRPHLPFHLSERPQRPSPARQPQLPTKFIVQTFGPHGRTYELQTHKSPAIYVAHETVTVPGNQQQHYQTQHQVQQPQQQLQLQHQHQHQQQHQQQFTSTAYKNPLLVNTNTNSNFQQVGLVAPPAPISYYTQLQPQAQLQQSVDSYYRQPQALTVAQPEGGSYGPPAPAAQQQSRQEQPHNSNPQPYAIVTLPHGERVQDAGHGSGPPPEDNGHSAVPPRVGDYSAQSPSATLDTYNYKQSVPGDTRSYQRYVTNCLPNGQCQQLNLNPGQIDTDHQQLLQAARAQTQPAKSDCNKDLYVPPGAQQNAQGQLRPRDRRTNAHVQEQLAKYPYN